MKFVKLILPLALAVSSTYAAAAYELRVFGKKNDGTYGYIPKGCFCRKSECHRNGRFKPYMCVMSYDCGTC